MKSRERKWMHVGNACYCRVMTVANMMTKPAVDCRHLYEVLRRLAQCSGPRRRLLVACNKADLGERAFSQAFIVRQLEKELCDPATALARCFVNVFLCRLYCVPLSCPVQGCQACMHAPAGGSGRQGITPGVEVG